jgi:DNA-binding SARP family transcriptional activator
MTEERWRIQLLGGLHARRGDRVLAGLQRQQPALLLAYLAFHSPSPRSRDTLVDLLWPETDPDTGRHNLRPVLHALRRLLEPADTPPGTVLIADNISVRLNPAAVTTDVLEFRAALADAARAQSPEARAASLAAAVALYRGELLPDFYDPWVLTERPPLAEAYLAALHRLALEREQAGDLDGALEAAQQAIRADPLREEAHYEVMRLYAALGQPSACLRQYQELERVLREELDEVPSAQVRALAEELRQGARSLVVARSARAPADRGNDGAAPTVAPDPGGSRRAGDGAIAQASEATDGSADAEQQAAVFLAPSRPLPPPPRVGVGNDPVAPSGLPSRLPVQLTRFFGRVEEIAWITQTLCSPDVRLVTLTGPGGTGKTRLAITVAARLMDAWRGGAPPAQPVVRFVPLADVAPPAPGAESAPDRIAAAIAAALGLPPSAEESPLGQVVEALGRRPTLLMLDNFEHLLAEGAPLVRALLDRVPSLTCLVTSRQHLDLVGEQEFAVLPLPTPRVRARPVFRGSCMATFIGSGGRRG